MHLWGRTWCSSRKRDSCSCFLPSSSFQILPRFSRPFLPSNIIFQQSSVLIDSSFQPQSGSASAGFVLGWLPESPPNSGCGSADVIVGCRWKGQSRSSCVCPALPWEPSGNSTCIVWFVFFQFSSESGHHGVKWTPMLIITTRVGGDRGIGRGGTTSLSSTWQLMWVSSLSFIFGPKFLNLPFLFVFPL